MFVGSADGEGGVRLRYATASLLLLFSIVAAGATPDAFAVCGDGVLEEPLEQCDDGNVLPSDCCSPDCQYEQAGTPCDLGGICAEFLGSECDGASDCLLVLDGCLNTQIHTVGKLVDRDPSSRDFLKIRYKNESGGSSPEELFGDPSAATRYAICVTDNLFLRASEILYSAELPTGAGWVKKPTGYVYRESGTATGPFRRVKLWAKPSASAGRLRTKVKVKATGSALLLPLPETPTHYFDWTGFESAPTFVLANEAGYCGGLPQLPFVPFIEPRQVTWKRIRLGD